MLICVPTMHHKLQ